MGLKDAKEGKLLYHLTELKNLESIIDFGLVPRKILRPASYSQYLKDKK